MEGIFFFKATNSTKPNKQLLLIGFFQKDVYLGTKLSNLLLKPPVIHQGFEQDPKCTGWCQLFSSHTCIAYREVDAVLNTF